VGEHKREERGAREGWETDRQRERKLEGRRMIKMRRSNRELSNL